MYKRGLIILNWICISVFCICIFQSISIKKRIQIQNQEIEQIRDEGSKEHKKHQKRMKILYDEKEKWMKENKGKNPDIFFEEIINALIEIESGGNLYSINKTEQAYGPMQIRQGALDDLNQKFKTNYKLTDFLGNLTLSRWAFFHYGKIYGAKTLEEKARCWNSGPYWKEKYHLTNEYWQKITSKI